MGRRESEKRIEERERSGDAPNLRSIPSRPLQSQPRLASRYFCLAIPKETWIPRKQHQILEVGPETCRALLEYYWHKWNICSRPFQLRSVGPSQPKCVDRMMFNWHNSIYLFSFGNRFLRKVCIYLRVRKDILQLWLPSTHDTCVIWYTIQFLLPCDKSFVSAEKRRKGKGLSYWRNSNKSHSEATDLNLKTRHKNRWWPFSTE